MGRTVNKTSGLRVAFALVSVVSIAFVAGYYFAQSQKIVSHGIVEPPRVGGFIWPPPPPIDRFKLTDTSGVPFNENQLNDHWTLIFFGYTHCPDICPVTMQTLKIVSEKLTGNQVFDRKGQVLFVSVDAERDTPEVLRIYADYFNPQFLAATAPPEELYQLTAQFGMQFMKISGSKADEYFFDHPSSILLVGPDNRVTGVFTPPLDADDIARQIREIVNWGEKRS